MTNAEKFQEVFNLIPDRVCCVLECEQFDVCPFYEELDGGCRCDMWWTQEYKRKANK